MRPIFALKSTPQFNGIKPEKVANTLARFLTSYNLCSIPPMPEFGPWWISLRFDLSCECCSYKDCIAWDRIWWKTCCMGVDRELKDSTLDGISRSEDGIRLRLSTSSHALYTMKEDTKTKKRRWAFLLQTIISIKWNICWKSLHFTLDAPATDSRYSDRKMSLDSTTFGMYFRVTNCAPSQWPAERESVHSQDTY